ncbi:DUF6777 domain-containing protein [Mycobacterium sp. IS-1496]|uniref:DUF6777 domain-containing protein n=1 Tax=Mycobacterium sp. IS-1496 TaxID=1772284 RepID=UPI0012FAE720|nr:DUF6777 domain-containing protein [Mycobacterium sp. IS-1496]
MGSQREDRVRRLAAVIASTSVAAAGVYVVGCTKSEFANAPEIMLEAASSSGSSPWMDSISTAEAPTAVPSSATILDSEAETTQELSGAEIGLYGGTPNSPVCDREKMDLFLGENPDKADAFRQVTKARDIGDFLGGLSPVVLTADTRVTNHGFDNGVTTFQSVLQKGTTVLVNDTGEPVVRCACGNPLAPPAALAAPVSQLRFRGDQWEDWNIKRLTAVRPAVEPIKTFVLSDVVAQQNLPADAPPPPLLAIEPGEPVPFVATPQVVEEAQQTLRAEEAVTGESSVSDDNAVTDDQTSDSIDSGDSSGTDSTPETETESVTESPVTETEEDPVTEGETPSVDPALVPEGAGEPPSEDPTEPVVGTDPAELPVEAPADEVPPATEYVPELPPITDYIPEITDFMPTAEVPAP